MSKSWIPLRDLPMQAFCNGFLATIQSSSTTYGLATGDVTSLTTATDSYNSALAALAEPSTHTRPAVAAKRTAKQDLLALMRNLYKKVRAANLSHQKLEELGLPVPVQPSSIPVPG